jgi:hypothetical protein
MSILLARRHAERELIQAKDALERKAGSGNANGLEFERSARPTAGEHFSHFREPRMPPINGDEKIPLGNNN